MLTSLFELKEEIATLTMLVLGVHRIYTFFMSEYRLFESKVDSIRQRGGSAKSSITWTEMLEYRMDYYFSASKWAKVVLLLGFTFMLIAFGGGMLAILGEDRSISNSAWTAWTYVADPGTHADCPESLSIRMASFTITCKYRRLCASATSSALTRTIENPQWEAWLSLR